MGTVETTLIPVTTLMDMIQGGKLELPEIQRPFVWYRPQVRDLIDSLYRGYPIGTILLWDTESVPHAHPLHVHRLVSGQGLASLRYLLDGQQRLTALTRAFRDGNPDIRFNIETEEFQVSNAAIQRDPRFIPIAEVFSRGAVEIAATRGILERPERQLLLERLNRLHQLEKYAVPVHILKGFDYEEITEIFVRVNSKGTRLRESELALARLAFRLPGLVTSELKSYEEELDDNGYEIDLRFLVRCLNAVATGQSRFGPLAAVPESATRDAWKRTRGAIDYFLNLVKNNLGIESAAWLPSINAIVVPVAYLAGRKAQDVRVTDLLQWFVLASTWQRYAGAAETAMDQDLRALGDGTDFAPLIQQIKQDVGRLHVEATDLDDAGSQSPFFLLAYLACRHNGATDWFTGVRLSSTNLGTPHLLELHHIFPRGLLGGSHSKRDVNELANLAFLSSAANKEISMSEPAKYLPGISDERLRQQFIPLDRSLWLVGAFQTFLAARRELLAAGMNRVLAGLGLPEVPSGE